MYPQVERCIRTHVFYQIRDGIALNLQECCGKRSSRGGLGIDADGVIHKIWGKCGLLNLAIFQIAGQLMNDSTYHFQMPQFFCTYNIMEMTPYNIKRSIAGYDTTDIPDLAFISIHTVKKHNRNIYEKLGVASCDELMLYIELFRCCGRLEELTGAETETE